MALHLRCVPRGRADGQRLGNLHVLELGCTGHQRVGECPGMLQLPVRKMRALDLTVALTASAAETTLLA